MSRFLFKLENIIADRKRNPCTDSYTSSLFASGEDEIVKKVGEESVEVVLAAKAQGDERLVAEVADLMYHVLVLLASHDLSLDNVEDELEVRHGVIKSSSD